ncbi:MAG: type II toxin-antitoxin system RelE/ParE family toxin [Candidatus Hydrogenedentes bacterium]|nr:type II toxin-antitoxin system RelE/ParE family toxin [Candidatus Hydrogenedentota bacterium]
MAKVRWSEEASSWLTAIHDYVARDDIDAADKIILGIYHRAEILETFPRCGHFYTSSGADEIRILLFGHYRIAYVIDEDDCANILGVFHGSLDIERFLPKEG